VLAGRPSGHAKGAESQPADRDVGAYAGTDLEEGLKYPNLISPADLYNMIAQNA
jgi:hypothetical protein